MAVSVHTRQTSHLPCIQVSGAPNALYPRNFQHRLTGCYYETFVRNGDLRLRRSHSATPPFAYEVVAVAGPGISYPWLYFTPRGWAILLYGFAGDIYLSTSYDEGLSWSAGTVAIAGAQKPFGAVNPFDGLEVIAAFVTATEKIALQTRAPGELSFGTTFTFRDQTGAEVLFENDTMAIHWGFRVDNPAVAHLHVLGESATSTWRSYNLGDTTATPTWVRET